MTMTEEALGVFIGGSGVAGVVAAAIVYMVRGALATAVQQAGAREIERLKSDLAKGLEKERQEAATALEGFKAQLTLAAEVRRQMAARKVDALVNVINVTHTLIGRVLALKDEGGNRASVSDGSAEFMSPRMKAFNDYGLAYRQAEAFADPRSNQAMFDFLRLLQERVTASSVSDILAASPVLEAGRRELIAAIREDYPKDAIDRCRQRIRLVRKARSVFTSPVTIYFNGLIKLSGPMRRGVLVNYESRRTPPPPDAQILCLVPTQPDQAVEGYGPKETEAADDSEPGRTDVFLDFGGIDRENVLARERATQATARPTRPHQTSARPAPKPAGPARAERLAAEEVGRRRRDVLAATLDELRGSSK